MFEIKDKDKNKNIVVFVILIYIITISLYSIFVGFNFRIFLFNIISPILFIVFFAIFFNRSFGSKFYAITKNYNECKIEKEKALSKFSQLENHWRNLTTILSCSVLTIDNKGFVIKLVNNLFSNSMIIGSNIYEVFPAENLPVMRKSISKAFSNRQTTRFLLKTIKTIDNSTVWHEAVVTPVKSFEEVIAVDIVFVDSTKHKQSQSEKEK